MEVVSTTNTAVDPSTVSAPRCFDGLEVRDDSRWILKEDVVIVVVFVSIVVCDPSSSSIPVTESDFILNA